MSSADFTPRYKPPISERWFGIGKLKPPTVSTNSKGELPMTIQLGEHRLVMDENGKWQLSNEQISLYQRQIALLEQKVAEYERERLDRRVYEMEKKSIEIERTNIQLLNENNQLRFKNKVLMAMCTISEGDYKALCREAGIEPRSHQRNTVTDPAQQSQAQPQTLTNPPPPLSTTSATTINFPPAPSTTSASAPGSTLVTPAQTHRAVTPTPTQTIPAQR